MSDGDQAHTDAKTLGVSLGDKLDRVANLLERIADNQEGQMNTMLTSITQKAPEGYIPIRTHNAVIKWVCLIAITFLFAKGADTIKDAVVASHQPPIVQLKP